MKKIFSTTVALAVMAIFISSAQAAVNIKEATIENGQVFIAGKQAQRRAAISWEGVALGINSDRDGDFKFATADLPEDCVGRLKVGTEERDVVVNNCTPTPITVIEGGVLKTGQTTCWDPADTVLPIATVACASTGQDGDFQAGTPVPSPRFTDNLNGTITDNLTALIWLTNANCFSTRPWATAISDANTLASGACGLTDGSVAGDWRLPNRNELTSLLDLGRSNPALPSGPSFSNFQASNYWSSTTVASTPSNAWEVIFLSGGVSTGGVVKTNVGFVIAVRGGS